MSDSLKTIKERLLLIQEENDPYLKLLRQDSRVGVQKLLSQWEKRLAKEAAQVAKYQEMMVFEQAFYEQGHRFIAGIDEVGRGPLAGPVVACAVILSPDHPIYGLDDSKKLSAKRRGELFTQIQENALGIGIGVVEPSEIDRVNIYQASRQAMLLAVEELPFPPSALLLDAMTIDSPLPQEKIIKGDARSVSIAAASIVAKELRDSLMKEYHEQYPHYGFDKNAGYGTKVHLEGLEKYGPCDIHRRTFAPVAAVIK